MVIRDSNSWQLILADLALILFLVATAAIADEGEKDTSASSATAQADVPAQALYRPYPGAPTLSQWLEQQRPDPRMTLSVVATHPGDQAEMAWHAAQELAQSARKTGIRVRVVLREGDKPDLYASLAYDDIG